MSETSPASPASRRSFLRGAALAGTAVWAVPAVQLIGLNASAAEAASGVLTQMDSATKVVVNDVVEQVGDTSSSTAAAGDGATAGATGTANEASGGGTAGATGTADDAGHTLADAYESTLSSTSTIKP